MAEPSDLLAEITKVSEEVGNPGGSSAWGDARKQRDAAKRMEAMSLRLAGLTYAQIGERLGISEPGAFDMVTRTLERAENVAVHQMRELEAARLDRAQAAIWTRVLEGDTKAVDTFLRISQRRARLFGLDSPTKVDLSVGIRQEMEEALTTLQNVILGEVIQHVDDDE